VNAIPLIAFHNAPLFKAGFFTRLRKEWEKAHAFFPENSKCDSAEAFESLTTWGDEMGSL
jgi:hypothetical protein